MKKKILIDTKTENKEQENKQKTLGVMLSTIQSLYPDKINFSISETAKIINLSYDFVREKVKCGLINSVSYGDRTMISVFEIARILTEGV